jgi:hypothetical protein
VADRDGRHDGMASVEHGAENTWRGHRLTVDRDGGRSSPPRGAARLARSKLRLSSQGEVAERLKALAC